MDSLQTTTIHREHTMDDSATSGSKGKALMLLLFVAAAVMGLLKKKREQELDEALWEEPRAL